MSVFTGASFSLESVEQTGESSLRLKYKNDPLAASSAGANDALNVNNYTLTGPGTNYVTAAQVVPSDTQSIDLALAAQLVPGTWTITVANVQTAAANPLTAPLSLSFVAVEGRTNEALSKGAESDNPETNLRKYLSPAMTGPGWDAILAAIATGDTYLNETAERAFDQMFKSTASGVYLDRRAADDGFSRPANIGISDDVFRKIAIKTTARKQISQVLLETLETFYGSEATRAHSTSASYEPFALAEGDSLMVQVDGGRTITVVFEQDDFSILTAATAAEVSSAITRVFRQNKISAYAVAYTDPALDQSYVRIFSGSLGLHGSVKVVGGRVQNVLKFPTTVHEDDSDGPITGTQFTITTGTGLNGVAAGRVRFTNLGGADPDLASVRKNDYVLIYGSVFSSSLRDTYAVIDATTTYFEIINSNLSWPASVTLGTDTDLRFFRPTNRTIQSTGRMATATQGDPSTLNIILPATTQAVGREENTGAYLHAGTALDIQSIVRATSGIATVTTSTNHGLVSDQLVFIDGAKATQQSASGLGWADAAGAQVAENSVGVKLADGRVLFCGGDIGAGDITTTMIYDPDDGTWFTAADMNRTRKLHNAVLLNDGRVLVVGGNVADISETYDPETDTWTDTSAHTLAYESSTLTVLRNGNVLSVGGNGTELFNPLTGTWSTPAQPAQDRIYHTATMLGDGRVLIAGGTVTLLSGFNTGEVYNPVNDTWVTTGTHSARFGHAAVFVPIGPSGSVLIVGGSTNSLSAMATAQLFNPATMAWTSTGSLSTARFLFPITTLSDRRVLVAGGLDNSLATIDTTEIYDLISQTWSAGATMLGEHEKTSLITLDNKKVLIGGSYSDSADSELLTVTVDPINAGRLNGLFRILTTPGAASFTVQTDTLYATTAGASGTVTPYRAPTNGVKGPFIYDMEAGLAITDIETTITQELTEGNTYTVITVADADDFPDEEGYLSIGFGTEDAVATIKYLARLSTTQILIDPSFVFPKTVPSGSTITWLTQRGVWTPEDAETLGSMYITASSAGRIAAEDTIDSLVGAGLSVEKTVVYPSDKGLGNEGYPASGSPKISDKVKVWGGDDVDEEIDEAREE